MAEINAALLGVGATPAEGVQTLPKHNGLAWRQHQVAHGAFGGFSVQHQAPLIQLDVLQVVPLLLLLLPLGTWGGAAGQVRVSGMGQARKGAGSGTRSDPRKEAKLGESEDSREGVGVARQWEEQEQLRRVGPGAGQAGKPGAGGRPGSAGRSYNQRSSQARERWWKGKEGGQGLRRQSEVIGLTSLPSRVGLGTGEGGRARSRSQSRSEGEEGE